jgi:hypothetical protein
MLKNIPKRNMNDSRSRINNEKFMVLFFPESQKTALKQFKLSDVKT